MKVSQQTNEGQHPTDEALCECYNEEKKLILSTDMEDTTFHKCKEEFKKQINFTGMIYRYLFHNF